LLGDSSSNNGYSELHKVLNLKNDVGFRSVRDARETVGIITK